MKNTPKSLEIHKIQKTLIDSSPACKNEKTDYEALINLANSHLDFTNTSYHSRHIVDKFGYSYRNFLRLSWKQCSFEEHSFIHAKTNFKINYISRYFFITNLCLFCTECKTLLGLTCEYQLVRVLKMINKKWDTLSATMVMTL